MEDKLEINKLDQTDTFSSKLLNTPSNDFPSEPNKSSPENTKRKNSLLDLDEEQQFLLNESSESETSIEGGSRKSNLLVNLFMFFNICRSFIAIGVLAIPFSLSKIGEAPFTVNTRNLGGIRLLNRDHVNQPH